MFCVLFDSYNNSATAGHDGVWRPSTGNCVSYLRFSYLRFGEFLANIVRFINLLTSCFWIFSYTEIIAVFTAVKFQYLVTDRGVILLVGSGIVKFFSRFWGGALVGNDFCCFLSFRKWEMELGIFVTFKSCECLVYHHCDNKNCVVYLLQSKCWYTVTDSTRQC